MRVKQRRWTGGSQGQDVRGGVEMRSINRKVSLAIGAAIVSVGLFGAVAFAAFAPDASTTTTDALFGQSNLVATNDIKHDKLKDLLDGLRAKGVITQAQEDALLAALN